MRIVDKLTDNWTLIAIETGEDSPMENHLGGEIAVDDENKRFYMHETFIVFYGTDSIKNSCYQYINK